MMEAADLRYRDDPTSSGGIDRPRLRGVLIEGQVRTRPIERVIGSIRRECLDHVIVLNERHLRRVLRDYVGYYQWCTV